MPRPRTRHQLRPESIGKSWNTLWLIIPPGPTHVKPLALQQFTVDRVPGGRYTTGGSCIMRKATVLLFALTVLAAAGSKENPKLLTASGGAENDHVELQATVVLDKDQIHSLVGADLPSGIAVVQIKAIPKGEGSLSIGRDDFTLVSHKDGQRSGPYAPSEIAGHDALVVSQHTLD